MRSLRNRGAAVSALKAAIPYIRLYKGKTFVIKAGGALFSDLEVTREFLEQVSILHQVGIRTVLVHGGGAQTSELARALGLEPRFVAGRRVTDQQSLEVTAMVLNGTINTRLLALLRDLRVPAVGLSGVDAGLIRARKRPPVQVERETVDYGFVGDIEGVNAGVLTRLLEAGLLPVVSPLSADEEGTLLNINADTVAAALAVALGAEKLILVTAAPGILADPQDPASLVSYLDLRGLEQLRREGKLAAGMLPKAAAIREALHGGVRRVHVISGSVPESLLLEVFTNEGSGTLIVSDVDSLTPTEKAAGGGQ